MTKRGQSLNVGANRHKSFFPLIKPKWQKIKQQCINQNNTFKSWDNNKKWQLFHSSHYDWWAFPIDQDSGSYGSDYKLLLSDINILNKDETFLKALQSNALLVCRSWGWNLQTGAEIKKVNDKQKWQRWPIRLSKMCRSLEIFGQKNKNINSLFVHAIQYGIILIEKHQKFTFGGIDLAPYFFQKRQQIFKKSEQKKKREEIKVEKNIEQNQARLVKKQEGIQRGKNETPSL